MNNIQALGQPSSIYSSAAKVVNSLICLRHKIRHVIDSQWSTVLPIEPGGKSLMV